MRVAIARIAGGTGDLLEDLQSMLIEKELKPAMLIHALQKLLLT